VTDQEVIDFMARMGTETRQYLIRLAMEAGMTREEAERLMSQPIHISINGWCVACRGVCKDA